MARRIKSGDVALKLNIDEIKDAVRGPNLDAAMFLGGSVMFDAAEARARPISKHIADRMYVVTAKHVRGKPHKQYDALVKKEPGTVIVSSSSPLTHILELGTKPHVERPAPKERKFRFRPGRKPPRKFRSHPGTAAQPFLRPALDESSGAARETIVAMLRESLGKA